MHLSRRVRAVFCLFFILLLFGSVAAQGEPLPRAVRQAMKQAGIARDAVGIYVQAVGARQPLTALNGDKPFSPASTMKLVTTRVALDTLGAAYRWKTRAYIDGVLQGDVLQGDLIIKGGGDPKLVTENFWLFLRQIRARGIREIRGNLVLDRSAFEESEYDPARFDGDASRPYSAGADALLLDYGAFQFQFVPNPATGSVKVIMDPPFAGYKVQAPRLKNDECGDWQKKLGANFNGAATFAGTYSNACGERHWYLHPYPMTPNQYFTGVFLQMWHELGGSLQGVVKSGVTPPSAQLLDEWNSMPLAEAIRDMNKFSNNVMARQLLLTLASEALHLPANEARGAQVIEDWFAAHHIAAPELVIENGSGLSRAERIAPKTMARVLQDTWRSPLMPEFIASLPLVGVDGTMQHRLAGESIAGNAHIKSGSLDGVRAIAGYVLAKSGKRYVVVSFIEHRDVIAAQAVQDALLQWVYEHGK